MADTIAKLIFQADTSGLKEANKELGELTKNASSAQDAANKKNQATKTGTRLSKEEAQANKIANAVRRAEINAYKEAAVRKKKAAEQSKKLAAQINKSSAASQRLSESFRNASNATATLTGPLNGLSGRLSFISTGLNRIGIAGVAAGAGVAGMGFAVSNSLRLFQNYERQMFKLEAVVKSTGASAGFSASQLNDMAIQAGRDTLTSSEDIRNAQAIMLTFKAVQDDVFKRSIALTADVGAVMGTTAASGAKSLGKALEDPITNLGALTRNGISFSEAEKEKIKTLAESNKLSEAQNIILDKIQEQVGGAAGGGGLVGATDLLADNFQQFAIGLAESSGLADFATTQFTSLAKAMGSLADLVTTTTDEKIEAYDKEIASIKYLLDETGIAGGERIKQEMRLNEVIKKRAGLEVTRKKEEPFEDDFDFEEADFADPVKGPLDDVVKKAEAEKKAAQERRDIRAQEQAEMAEEAATELERLNIVQLEKQGLLEQAAQAERELKERLATEDMERQIASGDLEKSVAESLHAARMERIATEHGEKVALIQENEIAEQVRQEDLRNKKKEEEEKFFQQNLKDSEKWAKKRERLDESLNKTLIKKSGQLFQALLGDSKAAAVAGVAISAAAAAGRIIAEGAAAAQGIKTAYYTQAALQGNPALKVAGDAAALQELTASKALAVKTAAIQFGLGVAGVAGGSSGGGGGGGASGSAAAASAPIQPAANDEAAEAPSVINVTVDGSIDPSGARRIIEAINEATEDGLEINALVGT